MLAPVDERAEQMIPRILIMEDDVDLAFWMKRVLETEAFDVTWSRSGSEALELLEAQTFDLLIADIYVYKKGRVTTDGGIGLIAKLRLKSLEPGGNSNRKLPIIAMSAAVKYPGNENILKTAEQVGADITMKKPIREETLLQTVHEAILLHR